MFNLSSSKHFAASTCGDNAGENVIEHLAGVEDYEVAEAAYLAVKRWPKAVECWVTRAARSCRPTISQTRALPLHEFCGHAQEALTMGTKEMLEEAWRSPGLRQGRFTRRRKETLAQAWMREHPDDEPCPQPENSGAAHAWRLKRGIGGSAAWAAEKKAKRAEERAKREKADRGVP